MTYTQYLARIKQLLNVRSLKGIATDAELEGWYKNLVSAEHVVQLIRNRGRV